MSIIIRGSCFFHLDSEGTGHQSPSPRNAPLTTLRATCKWPSRAWPRILFHNFTSWSCPPPWRAEEVPNKQQNLHYWVHWYSHVLINDVYYSCFAWCILFLLCMMYIIPVLPDVPYSRLPCCTLFCCMLICLICLFKKAWCTLFQYSMSYLILVYTNPISEILDVVNYSDVC